MSYFDIFEELNIVSDNGAIKACFDEWFEDMQLSDKLRQALCWEDDENYETFQQDQFSQEFIFNLFKYLVLGGGMCQFDDNITEYLDCTKLCYKDLITVAKNQETNEIEPLTIVFKINAVNGAEYLKCNEHTQNFMYVLVDP